MAKPKPTAKLVALRSLSYDTRRLLPGDQFEATPAHGRLLVAVKKARLVREVGTVAPPPAAVKQKAAQMPVGGGRLPFNPPPMKTTAEGFDEAMANPRSISADDGMQAMRAAYQDKFGRRPDMRWSIDTLREKLAETDAPPAPAIGTATPSIKTDEP